MDRPATYPVTGTVTQDGTPLAGATVNFQLADGSLGAIGTTDAEGKYTLTTYDSDDGAVVGDYKVGIAKYAEAAEEDTASDESDDYALPGGSSKQSGSGNLIPQKFADVNQSGFSATVTEAGPNSFDFNVETK